MYHPFLMGFYKHLSKKVLNRLNVLYLYFILPGKRNMKRLGTLIVCIFSLFLYGLKAQVYTITTYAGKGIAAYYGNRIKATAAELNYPCGVVSDLLGNIYIA